MTNVRLFHKYMNRVFVFCFENSGHHWSLKLEYYVIDRSRMRQCKCRFKLIQIHSYSPSEPEPELAPSVTFCVCAAQKMMFFKWDPRSKHTFTTLLLPPSTRLLSQSKQILLGFLIWMKGNCIYIFRSVNTF